MVYPTEEQVAYPTEEQEYPEYQDFPLSQPGAFQEQFAYIDDGSSQFEASAEVPLRGHILEEPQGQAQGSQQFQRPPRLQFGQEAPRPARRPEGRHRQQRQQPREVVIQGEPPSWGPALACQL